MADRQSRNRGTRARALAIDIATELIKADIANDEKRANDLLKRLLRLLKFADEYDATPPENRKK